MADCSNAQFSPKILANKEPYLIFAYRLFYSYHDLEDPNNYEKQIDGLERHIAERIRFYTKERRGTSECVDLDSHKGE